MTSASATGARGAIAALWPAPASARAAWSPFGAGTDYLAVPSPRRPRLLVPVDVQGADRLLLRHGGGRRTRAGRLAWRTAQRSRLARWAPLPRLRVVTAPDGIEAFLSEALGQAVRIGVLLGPDRANLKPVLALYPVRPRGGSEVLGFSKLATTPVTEPLLATEAAALRLLATSPVDGVTVPRVLHLGTWCSRPLLVLSPLSLAQTGRRPVAVTPDVVAGIAAVAGLTEQRLGDSGFWRQHGRPVSLSASWSGVDASALQRLRAAVPVEARVTFGSWHGDLGPWNAAQGPDHLEVWDWERFASDVPAGLDAAHWRVQLDLAAGTDPARAWPAMRREVAQVLQALRRDDSQAPVVCASYLLAIVDRYRGDAADEPTPALRRRVRWLCRLADVVAEALHEQQERG